MRLTKKKKKVPKPLKAVAITVQPPPVTINVSMTEKQYKVLRSRDFKPEFVIRNIYESQDVEWSSKLAVGPPDKSVHNIIINLDIPKKR